MDDSLVAPAGFETGMSKGQLGQRGEWVGAYFRPLSQPSVQGVVIGITKERAEQLHKRCQKLLGMGDKVPRAAVR